MDTLNLPSFSLSGRVLVRTALLKSTSQSEGAPYSTCWHKTVSNVGWINPMNTIQTKQCTNAKNMRTVAGILHFSKVSLSISRLPPFPILRLEPVSRMPWRNLHIFPPKVWSKCSSQRLSPAHLQLLLCQALLLGELLALLWLTQRSRHQHGDWRERRKHLKRFQGDVDSRFNWRLLDWRLLFFRCRKMNMKKSPSWLRYVTVASSKKHISPWHVHSRCTHINSGKPSIIKYFWISHISLNLIYESGWLTCDAHDALLSPSDGASDRCGLEQLALQDHPRNDPQGNNRRNACPAPHSLKTWNRNRGKTWSNTKLPRIADW